MLLLKLWKKCENNRFVGPIDYEKDYDVFVVGDLVTSDDFFDAKAQVVECRQRFPNSSTFVVENYRSENRFLWSGIGLSAQAVAKSAGTATVKQIVANQQLRYSGGAKFIGWPVKREMDC